MVFTVAVLLRFSALARLAWGLINKECLNVHLWYPEGLHFYTSTLHSKIMQ
jgi:hypothetical protein